MLNKFCTKCKHFIPYYKTYYVPNNPEFGFCELKENCPFATEVNDAIRLDYLIKKTQFFLDQVQTQLDRLDVSRKPRRKSKNSDKKD